ncbi:MAG TPA: UDP-N-acetylmuramate dehydrogenase [Phycisphaerales bacterium]|nr:UDP-N-acetylmuramate dehydrogenase [Phycisphaerales bacterium]
MATATLPDFITHAAPIKTWFGIGGSAARFAKPRTADDLRTCLAIDPALRVLGDGANLLVDDDGINDLVVSLDAPALAKIEVMDAEKGLVRAGAGVHIFKLMNTTIRSGLGGLEVLAGVPATLGGAIVMNAGGAFGQIADVIERVYALDRAGREVVLERGDINFSYRHSGLTHLIVTAADLRLTPGDAAALEARKKEINDYKLRVQPMSANSAGCCFKNPTLPHAIEGIGEAGKRVSAGLLIDRAGLKGLRHQTARVSDLHGNFLVVDDKSFGKARDVIALMDIVTARVHDRFGVRLDREVVVWSRHH